MLTMKTSEYKIAGGIAKERALDGILIRTREAESLEEFAQLVENGDPENVRKLAQGQLDIIVQRKIRDYVESEEVADILAGKTVDGEDFGAHTEEERKQVVAQRAQAVSDDYLYGGRAAGSGAGTKAKKAVATVAQLASASANDPELAAKLAALGITL
jgi:hypothetical protein